jgi:transcriptional regulator
MYNPLAFKIETLGEMHAGMKACRTAHLLTATQEGPLASLLPMYLDVEEGEFGVLYAHMARANPQWAAPGIGYGLAVFTANEAYISPSWYASKAEHGKVVPTWNYESVHAAGPIEFFDAPERLLQVVDRLTRLHEGGQAQPWSIDDAPPTFIAAQLRGIVGLRMPIARLEGKRKMSQNRSAADRAGVKRGLSESQVETDHAIAGFIPT